LLLQVPPDRHQGRRPGKDRVHHPVRRLLRHDDVVRVEERRHHLPPSYQAYFKKQLNKNVEAYVDDVVVKTQNSDTLIADLEETFTSLREYQWNPNKCIFGVPSGKLLGFSISHHGIEANPEKISDITNMKAPTCIKDVEKLTGCMAALNRFISKLGECGLDFFKLLKHQEKFVWTTEADQALV
jgi:hypothetical protein